MAVKRSSVLYFSNSYSLISNHFGGVSSRIFGSHGDIMCGFGKIRVTIRKETTKYKYALGLSEG